jgi:hypothetical protein
VCGGGRPVGWYIAWLLALAGGVRGADAGGGHGTGFAGRLVRHNTGRSDSHLPDVSASVVGTPPSPPTPPAAACTPPLRSHAHITTPPPPSCPQARELVQDALRRQLALEPAIARLAKGLQMWAGQQQGAPPLLVACQVRLLERRYRPCWSCHACCAVRAGMPEALCWRMPAGNEIAQRRLVAALVLTSCMRSTVCCQLRTGSHGAGGCGGCGGGAAAAAGCR